VHSLCVVKAAFHYSSQLQTWSKTWSHAGRNSKACRKPAANLLKTGFLHSICLARARTSEPAAVRDQVFDKKSRKLVESVSQTRKNLSKTGLQPGLQLARIMECGLNRTRTHLYTACSIAICFATFDRPIRWPKKAKSLCLVVNAFEMSRLIRMNFAARRCAKRGDAVSLCPFVRLSVYHVRILYRKE